MKMMDPVKVIVEKNKYAKKGVHKGMFGWICNDECIDGYWLVNFPRTGEKNDLAEIGIHENDMIVVPVMDARVTEQIEEEFKNRET